MAPSSRFHALSVKVAPRFPPLIANVGFAVKVNRCAFTSTGAGVFTLAVIGDARPLTVHVGRITGVSVVTRLTGLAMLKVQVGKVPPAQGPLLHPVNRCVRLLLAFA